MTFSERNTPMNNSNDILQILTAPRPPVSIDLDPAWRWNRMVALARQTTHLPECARNEIPMLYSVFEFLRRFMGLNGQPGDPEQLAQDYPDISQAFSLSTDPSDKHRRQILEALVISGDEQARIAERLLMNPQVSMAYEYLFYDVRQILPYRLQVSVSLIGNLSAPEPGTLLKAVGHALGPDAVMRFSDPRAELTADDKVFMLRVMRKEVIKNALRASHSVRVTQRNAIELQSLFLRHEAARNRARSGKVHER